MTSAATIFALSSGAPPAGIAVVRISGPKAGAALVALTAQGLPEARKARLTTLRDPAQGIVLDHALVLWFPGPASATGEDCAELHLHGGRAVIAAVLDALSQINGLCGAEPGDFTRRAFENGRIDLAEAEGLGDLLRAETEAQRRSAIAQAGGALSRLVGGWQVQLVALSAQVEAAIDFSDEDDVAGTPAEVLRERFDALQLEIAARLADPPAERLRDGIRVVISGPPNAGKSTLLNALVAREAAIVSPTPGTTRDVIEVPVLLRGMAIIFVDTAGLRDDTDDAIERIGIARALDERRSADIVLALGSDPVDAPGAVIVPVHAKSDLGGTAPGAIAVSALTGEGIDALIGRIIESATHLVPAPDRVALNQRHRAALADALIEIGGASAAANELLVAEHLRAARQILGRVTGGSDVEAMLDALFGTFCIGK